MYVFLRNYGDMGSPDNDVMFPYVAERLSKYGLAYLHVMDGLSFGFHEKCSPVTALQMKTAFNNGTVISNIGLTRDTAEGMIRSGAVDLACFGRLYISNPDLVERFQNNWPLNPDATYEQWWKPTGAAGYTDFPFYKEEGKSELRN
jgi:N-ethylmaleimide reductase